MSTDKEGWEHEVALCAVNNYYPASDFRGRNDVTRWLESAAAALRRELTFNSGITPAVTVGTIASGLRLGTMVSVVAAGEIDALKLEAETWSARAVEAEAALEAIERQSTERQQTSQAWEKRCSELQAELSKAKDGEFSFSWRHQVDKLKEQLAAAQDCIKSNETHIATLTTSYVELKAAALEADRSMGAMEEEHATLLNCISERNADVNALVAAISRGEEEIQRLRSLLPTRKTTEWKKT